MFERQAHWVTKPVSLDNQGIRVFSLLPQSFRGFRVALWASLYWIKIPKKRVKFTHGLRMEKAGAEALFLFRALCRLYLYSCLPKVYQFNPAIHWRAAVFRCAPFLLPSRVYQMSTTGTFEQQIRLKTPVYRRIYLLLV